MPAKNPKVSDQIKNQFATHSYYRDTDRGILGGVIAGLANYTGWDLILLRVLFIFLLIFTAFLPLAIAYLIIWICAPDQSSAPAKSTRAKAAEAKEAETVESKEPSAGPNSAKSDTSTTSASVKSSNTPILLRIALLILGIIGFLTFIPMLIALIPITIIAIIAITGAEIVEAPLFITTAILLGVLLFTLVSVGLHISTALVTARLRRASLLSLVGGIIMLIILTIATTTTGVIWLRRAGKSGTESTLNSLSEDINIHIDDQNSDNSHVQIDLGPVHIHTN